MTETGVIGSDWDRTDRRTDAPTSRPAPGVQPARLSRDALQCHASVLQPRRDSPVPSDAVRRTHKTDTRLSVRQIGQPAPRPAPPQHPQIPESKIAKQLAVIDLQQTCGVIAFPLRWDSCGTSRRPRTLWPLCVKVWVDHVCVCRWQYGPFLPNPSEVLEASGLDGV